jgi:hypothetical protein
MKLPRRNIVHRHARLRSGAGSHKVKPRAVVTVDDWREEYGDNEMEMSLKDFREEHGIYNGTDFQDALKDWKAENVVPALCKGGCECARDGKCEHGNPSILVHLGEV